MRLEIAMQLPSVANLREHWATKARRVKVQRNVLVLCWPRTSKALFCLPAVVVLTRIAPRPLDSDNLASAFKALRDQVAAQLGVDDGDPRVSWLYAQERGEPKQHAVRIEVLHG